MPKTTGRAKEFTIDRSKWLQAKWITKENNEGRYPETLLRDKKGMQCCLGFYCDACGVRGRTGISSPGELQESEQKKLDKKFFTEDGIDSIFSSALMRKNDDYFTSDAQREKYVKEKFASIGVKVKFTGKYPY